ncbi:hypothetical protein SAMN05216302_1001228 [Nitrosomonas aestuarii]|uniref:Uncharacterized protein n=2 Tax=Nitrosomonas aestuarii TaxID=52441 RepID=A0A1I3XE32_9PROT|nr:hypothetical protein SAMN05216302_1001228 [Nitrosomonas aestuarii]
MIKPENRFNRLLKNVFEADSTRQRRMTTLLQADFERLKAGLHGEIHIVSSKKQSLRVKNKLVFNAATATQIVFQQPAKLFLIRFF